VVLAEDGKKKGPGGIKTHEQTFYQVNRKANRQNHFRSRGLAQHAGRGLVILSGRAVRAEASTNSLRMDHDMRVVAIFAHTGRVRTGKRSSMANQRIGLPFEPLVPGMALRSRQSTRTGSDLEEDWILPTRTSLENRRPAWVPRQLLGIED